MKLIPGLFILFICFSCQPESRVNYQQYKFAGKTMGTYYSVKCLAKAGLNLKESVDSLLIDVNDELSTYIPDSRISRFNQSEYGIEGRIGGTNHFEIVFNRAKEIYKASSRNFDPTVMPLVNYWGFGYTPKTPVTEIDRKKVDSLRAFVGFDHIVKIERKDSSSRSDITFFEKSKAGIQLDFSAIAKGYGVDAVAILLEEMGIENYIIEIGGEVRARGKSLENEDWVAGISRPDPDAEQNDIQNAVVLENLSMATSGNYRNYYEVDGMKYAHTISPQTGLPVQSDLLSASVIARDCMTADAFATAFMVMGLNHAFQLADSIKDMEAYFIYGTGDGQMDVKYTPGMGKLLASPGGFEKKKTK